jgi:phenylacetic acid degradation operon negative regulatory protein
MTDDAHTAARAVESARLPRPHTGSEPQHLLITLLGDYWFARTELIPSAALVGLLAEFGANENASRQAMRRLTTRGLLAQTKRGRTTFYGIPENIVATQRNRLNRAITFGEDFVDWDGEWTVVTFSIPESERDVRRLLRNGLRSLHFGTLQDGVWVTPHDARDKAMALLDRLDVARAHVMRARWSDRARNAEAVADAFELDELAAAYHAFLDRHTDTLAWARSGAATPSEALIRRTMVTNEWLSFRARDPELPVTLLPAQWPRPRARAQFIEIYDLLGPAAEVRFRAIVAAHSPALAELSAFHSSSE